MLLLGLGVILVGVAVFIRYRTASNPQLRIPQVRTRDLLPNVAKEISLRQDDILADPDSPQAWGMYGLVLLTHGFREEAAECFIEAERLDSEDYRWPYYYGMTMGMFDGQKALHAFQRAVRNEPNRVTLRLRLAEWQFDQRNMEAAEREALRSLEQEPGHPRAQLLLARLRLMEGKADEALRLAESAASSPQGNRRDVHELLARLYTRLGNKHQARRAVERAERLPRGVVVWDDPEMGMGATMLRDASILDTLATIYRARGQTDQWLAMLRRVVEQEPANIHAKEKLAGAFLELKQYEQAKRFIDQTLREDPTQVQFESLRGQVDMALGNVEEARKRFLKATQLKPDFDEAFMWLGRALAAQTKYPEAIEALRESVRLSPSLTDAHHELGLAYRAEDRLDASIDALQHAANLKPGDLEIALDLAETLAQADRRSAAVELLQSIVATAEDPAPAEEMLKKLSAETEPQKPEEQGRL